MSNIFEKLFSWNRTKTPVAPTPESALATKLPTPAEEVKNPPKRTIKPIPRTTTPPYAKESTGGLLASLDKEMVLVEPGYQFEVIPLIRKLGLSNQSVSQALSNIVNLANTGHKIVFDSGVPLDKAIEMRRHIEKCIPKWHYGVSGSHGLSNKLFEQIMIAGAVCVEVVPNVDLTGVARFFMPLPETIRFKYNKTTETYEPYQLKQFNNYFDYKKPGPRNPDPLDNLIKLNPNTFKYFAINGNTEIPYANPPYLPSLPPLHDQREMLDNIKWIIQQMGIWGFLEVLADLPDQEEGETDVAYANRCSAHLDNTRASILSGMKDGIVVGGKRGEEKEHEFTFHSPSKNTGGLAEVFDLNELLVYSGLKQDPALSGKAGTGAQSFITVVFTKLLSELKNVQSAVKASLEHAYEMELRLRGYNFKYLEVVHNPSTLADDLKFQQAFEIKIRNYRQLVMDGIISQEQYADAVGYDQPYKDEPVVPYAPDKTTGDPNLDAEKKRVREKSKDVSDRRVRDKNK